MTPGTLGEAYAFCRIVARAEAKNFYYAFRVLPRRKSDAMCAVYVFMRRADDIADDETKTLEERRELMAAWLAQWHGGHTRSATDDRVFQAVADAQQQFGIKDELLEDLVRGTSMDLEPGDGGAGKSVDLGGGVQGYRTFDDLYRYCYLVASVVGLVSIRIFGYSDPRAELLAEKTGVAFQLTNILRDIKEDAERKRIYLPQDMLREFGVANNDIFAIAGGRTLKGNERAMIAALSARAWEYYAAAEELLPLIDADSRAALWVMVKIYSGLLAEIDRTEGDVFSRRVSVPTRRKVYALVRGAAMSVGARAGLG